ncbi:MAG: 50S ribosomal protein L11 [Candidatus Woesearchaeota archaeon]
MAIETVEALIEGGKATAAPPLGPALGPKGVNIANVVAEINKKTAAFKGMQVPVKVHINTDDKSFSITLGTPPAAALIIKEAGLEKGSGHPKSELVADLAIEQIIKIAKMKETSLLGKDLKQKVKEIIGTCRSMGVKVEGVVAAEAIKLVNEGKFDKEIKEEKTELSEEEMKKLEEEKKSMLHELEEKYAKYEKEANAILEKIKDKERSFKVSTLKKASIPDEIINKLCPPEKGAADAKGGAAAPAKK